MVKDNTIRPPAVAQLHSIQLQAAAAPTWTATVGSQKISDYVILCLKTSGQSLGNIPVRRHLKGVIRYGRLGDLSSSVSWLLGYAFQNWRDC